MPTLGIAKQAAKSDVQGGFRSSIKRASEIPDLPKRRSSVRKTVVEDDDEPEEDDGFFIKQLMFALDDALSKNTQKRRSAILQFQQVQRISAGERLLNCIQKIAATTAQGRMQYKLQDFLLEFLSLPAPPVEPPDIDVQCRVNDRHKFWTPLRTNFCKWEGDPAKGGRGLSNDSLGSKLRKVSQMQSGVNAILHPPRSPSSAEQQEPFLHTASSFFSSQSLGGDSNEFQDTNSSWHKGRHKQRQTLHTLASSTSEGWFLTATKVRDNFDKELADEEAAHSLNWFPKRREEERLLELPGNAGYNFREQVPEKHKTRQSLCKKKTVDFEKWDLRNWDHRIKCDAGMCPLCPCKSGCFVPLPQHDPRVRASRVQTSKITPFKAYEASAYEKQGLTLNRSLPQLQPPGGEKNLLPPHYIEPFNNRRTHEHFASPQGRYFAACEKQGMLPRMPAFLVNWESDSIQLGNQKLLDHDLFALLDAFRIRKAREIDVSQNNFTDEGLQQFVRDLPSGSLTLFDISFSGAADGTLGAIADLMSSGCRRLHHLHLGGIHVSDSTWFDVCDALIEHNNLRTLDLRETNLGRMTQRAPVKIAEMLVQLTFLERLNLSGNFLFHSGCTALAEALPLTTSLTELDVSHNASSHLVPPRRRQRCKGKLPNDGPQYEEVANFNPILLLCEGFAGNTSLVSLSLSSSSLDYAGDFVLMDALRSHPKLENLDVSHNPHGEDGMRPLLRLLMPPECKIVFCDVQGARQSLIHGMEVNFDFSEPRGHYEINFDHPQHRSVLRQLFHRCQKYNEQIDTAFTRIQWTPPSNVDAAKAKAKGWYWKDDTGFWRFPLSGHISFDFVLARRLPPSKDPVETVKMYYRERRIPISMGRFVTLFTMFTNLRNSAQKAMLICAMQDQVLLKMAHLRKFLQSTPELVELIVNQLYSTVESIDKLGLFDLLKNPDSNRRFRRNARAAFFFNEHNPTDSYKLDLTIPSERTVAERIAVMNLFEMLPADAVDNTQHGFGEGVRNAFLDNTQIKHYANFAPQGAGILSMDYCSPRGPSKKSVPMLPAVFENIIGLLENSECNHEDQIRALRGVSHLMILHPETFKELLKIVPNKNLNKPAPANPMARRSSLLKFAAAARKARMLTKMGLVIKESAFQYVDTNPRISMFICFFNRCINQHEICTMSCLYDHKEMFSPACCKEITSRIGVLRTFDALSCHDPATNCGNRFECHLYIHEEWALAKFLIALAAIEDGENMLKCAWTERSFLALQGYDFIVPAEWCRDLPNKGTFSATYVEEKEEYRLLNSRQKLAEQICWGSS